MYPFENNVCSDLVQNSSSYRDAFANVIWKNFILQKIMVLPTPAEKRCSKPCNQMTIDVKNIGMSKTKGFNGSQFLFDFKPLYQYKATVLLWIGKELQLLIEMYLVLLMKIYETVFDNINM